MCAISQHRRHSMLVSSAIEEMLFYSTTVKEERKVKCARKSLPFLHSLCNKLVRPKRHDCVCVCVFAPFQTMMMMVTFTGFTWISQSIARVDATKTFEFYRHIPDWCIVVCYVFVVASRFLIKTISCCECFQTIIVCVA